MHAATHTTHNIGPCPPHDGPHPHSQFTPPPDYFFATFLEKEDRRLVLSAEVGR